MAGNEECADGAGWIFKRAQYLLASKQPFLMNRQGKQEIKESFLKAIGGLLKSYTRDKLILNSDSETWMDSVKRAGARIEIQALTLNTLDFACSLTGNKYYLQFKKELEQKVREKFFSGGVLSDSPADSTIRPNAFLAAYAYPQLLKFEEWAECFRKILPSLWLDWGGLSTIDKNNPLFVSQHTGEMPNSYHNGDSWFYLNNLAALVLYRVNKYLFKDYVEKILRASTKEILWQGLAGEHAELSSANGLKSEGCLSQAWSAAMYIELIEEIFGEKKRES
jgi:glycogen debranching enzyme